MQNKKANSIYSIPNALFKKYVSYLYAPVSFLYLWQKISTKEKKGTTTTTTTKPADCSKLLMLLQVPVIFLHFFVQVKLVLKARTATTLNNNSQEWLVIFCNGFQLLKSQSWSRSILQDCICTCTWQWAFEFFFRT